MLVTVALVVAAMMVATTVPAFAAKGGNGGGAVHSEESGTCTVSGITQPCDAKVVQTPSGNLNATVHGHPPKGGAPEGGNGGGAVRTDLSGTCTAEGGTQPCEGKAVQTPSGNLNVSVHGHPS